MGKLVKGIILTLLLFSFGQARILSVDPSGGGNYEGIHAAVTAAVPGDTVLCMSFNYFLTVDDGGVVIDKQLYLMGSGYDAVENGGTSIEILGTDAIFSFSVQAKGSVLKGFRLIGNGTTVDINADNIIVEENLFINKQNAFILTISGGVGDTVRSNIFTAKILETGRGLEVRNCTNILVNNNIFSGLEMGILNYGNSNFLNMQNIYIKNNCAIQNGLLEGADKGLDNSNVHSNIFINNTESILNQDGSPMISYNGFYNNSNNGMPGHEIHSDDPLFKNYSAGDAYGLNLLDKNTFDFHLQSNSTYVDDGYYSVKWRDSDGSLNDIGLYGGPWPFVNGFGIPNIPVVIEISLTPGTVSPNGIIKISAKGRIHNEE